MSLSVPPNLDSLASSSSNLLAKAEAQSPPSRLESPVLSVKHVLIISAVLIPAAAIPMAMLYRRLSHIQQALDYLRNTNASLAREMRMRMQREHASSAAEESVPYPHPLPKVHPMTTRSRSPATRIRDLQLVRREEAMLKDMEQRITEDLQFQTRRLRDVIRSEAAVAAMREGLAQAWRAQTTKQLMQLSRATSSREAGQRYVIHQSTAIGVMAQSLLIRILSLMQSGGPAAVGKMTESMRQSQRPYVPDMQAHQEIDENSPRTDWSDDNMRRREDTLLLLKRLHRTVEPKSE